MKKLLIVYVALISILLGYLYMANMNQVSDDMVDNATGLRGEMDEKYVIVNFLTGIDYWKNVLKGFEDAAGMLGVSIEYRGSTQYDAQEEVMVLEQVIARNPAGIAVSAIDSLSLNAAIDKAVEAGIPVVMFDSDAPDSRAYSFVGTDNYKAGVTAARKMGELTYGQGQVAIVTLPNQLNHQERARGFHETLRKEFPELRVVAVEDGRGDKLVTEEKVNGLLESYKELKGIFVTEANGGVGAGNALLRAGLAGEIDIISFDTDKGTLDMVRNGTIAATLAQGTWNMGYWSLMQLFHLRHGLTAPQPGEDGAGMGVAPVPTYIDTGITVVTKDNVDEFYAR